MYLAHNLYSAESYCFVSQYFFDLPTVTSNIRDSKKTFQSDIIPIWIGFGNFKYCPQGNLDSREKMALENNILSQIIPLLLSEQTVVAVVDEKWI